MGLAPPAIRFLAREHKNKPFKSPVLTLGRLGVWATYDEAKKILISEGIQPQPLEPDFDLTTRIPGQSSEFISDVALFRLFDVEELYALDISDYQYADIILDMNKQIPDELQGRFNLIIDGGTLDHVFDIRQAMMNISLMLKSEGRVIHLSPTSNYIGHGFYSFQPSLFFDYYLVNGFVNLKAYLTVEHSYLNLNKARWSLYSYKYDSYREVSRQFRSKYRVGTIFVAEKADGSTHNEVPIQANYRPESHRTNETKNTNYRRGLMNMINDYVKKMSGHANKYSVVFYIPRQLLNFANSLNKVIRDNKKRSKPEGYTYLGEI